MAKKDLPTWEYTSGMEWSPNQVLELLREKSLSEYGAKLDHDVEVELMGRAKEMVEDGVYLDMDSIYEILEEHYGVGDEEVMGKGGKIKSSDGKTLYTGQQLLSKYKGKFIDTYPHHHEYMNPDTHKYETVYEVRGVSSKIKENFQSPEEIVHEKGGKVGSKGATKYYAIWDGDGYLATGLNTRSLKDLKDDILSLIHDDTEDDDYKEMKKMSAHQIADIKGWFIEVQDEPFDEDNLSDGDEEGDDDFEKGGRITTNEGVLDSFLTNLQKEIEVGNLSTHYNEHDKTILLRNYGTLIAVRKADKVYISKKKFSKTTSIIQNKLEAMAKERHFYVEKVEEFEKGGKVEHSGQGDFGLYYAQHGAIITGGSYFNDGSVMGKGGKVSKDGDRHSYYIKAWKKEESYNEGKKPDLREDKSLNWDEAQERQTNLEERFYAVGIFAKKDNREVSISLGEVLER